MKLRYLAQAQADLDALPDAIYARIHKRLDSLRRYPALGTPLEGELTGYRRTVVAPYIIVYRALPGVVLVAYIRHSRRA